MAPSAHADVAFSIDNVLTSSTISNAACSVTWANGGNRWQITANKSVDVQSIAFFQNAGSHANNPSATILSDASDTPGTTIGTFGLVGNPAGNTIATYTTSTPIHLTGGTKYWIQINDYGACAPSTIQNFTGSAITVQRLDGSFTHWYGNTDYSSLQGGYYPEFAIYGLISTPTAIPTWTTYFDGNGATSGTAPSPIFVAYGGNAGFNLPGNIGRSTNSTSNAVLTRTGYTFLGWSTLPTATAPMTLTNYTFTPTGDTVLYAVWKANS